MRLTPRRRPPRERRRHQAPTPPTEPTPPPDPDLERRHRATRIRRAGYVLLIPLGLLAGAYSYVGVYDWVKPKWGEEFARGFPLLLDGWILIATCFYIAGAMEGKRLPFWRITAHGAVAGTILLNALSVQTPTDVVVHVVGPIIWSLFAEGVAHELLGDWKATHARTEFSRIPRRLWIASPVRSWQAAIRMHRVGHEDYRVAFDDLGLIDAALTVTTRRGLPKDDTKVILGWLRSGDLLPGDTLPVLRDPDVPPDRIVETLSSRIIDRERIAAEAVERAEAERRERERQADLDRLAHETRIAAQRAETERLERLATDERERAGDEPDPEDHDDERDGDNPGGGRHKWTADQLAWIEKVVDEARAANVKPVGSEVQARARLERPDLGIHDVNPVTVRGRVNKMWKAMLRERAEPGRVVPFRAQG